MGTIGNALVLYVYGFRWKPGHVTSTFILFVALLDMSSLLLCLPVELVILYMNLMFNMPLLCKVKVFVHYVVNCSAVIILVAIALDRWVKVSRPHSHIFGVKNCRRVCGCTLLVTSCFSWPLLILYGCLTVPVPGTNAIGSMCFVSDEYFGTKWVTLQFGTITAVFLFCVLSIFFLYTKVAMRLVVLRKKQIQRLLEKYSANAVDLRQPSLISILLMPDTQGYCSCCNFWSRGGRVRPYADDESQERETDSDLSSMSSTTFFFKLGKRQSSDVWRQSLSVMDNSGLPSASTYTQYSIPSISAIAKSKTKIVQKVRRRRRKRTVANGTQSVPRTPMKSTGCEMPHGVIQEEDESAVSSMPLQSPSPTQDALSCALSSAQVTDGQSTLSPSLTTSLSPTIRHINVGLVSLNAPQPTRHAPMVVNPPLNPSAESIQTAQTPRGSGTAGPHSPAEILPETGTLSDTRTDSQMKSGTEKSTSGTERVTRPVSALLYDSTRKFSLTVRDALSTTRGQVKTITSDLIDVFFRKKFRKGRTLYNPAKTTRMLFLITTISLLSYLPYFLVVLVVSSRGRAYFYGLGELDLVILNFCVRSPYISNVTNPIIYGLLNVHFRNEVLKLLGLKATSEKTPAGSPRHRKSISKPLT